MTRERLAMYRNNKAEILELDYMLQNRWKSDTMIGNNVIFDYSKGYPMPQSVVGFDQEKYERLQDRDLKRKEKLEAECEEIERFVENIKDSLTHRIFRIYYIDGRKDVTQQELLEATEWFKQQVDFAVNLANSYEEKTEKSGKKVSDILARL